MKAMTWIEYFLSDEFKQRLENSKPKIEITLIDEQ